MAKPTNKSIGGTSFHGVTFSATPNQLIKLFPNSYGASNYGQDKTNFEFILETDRGDVFSIYDWKEYRPIGMDEMIEWHIGAISEGVSLRAKFEVIAMLEKNSAEAGITKHQFMAFFRKEFHQLNDFDRKELFLGCMKFNPGDISPNLLVELFNESEADPNVLIQAFAKLNNVGLG